MNDTPIRIGMIGVGGMAQGHIERLLANPRSQIVAMCDPKDLAIQNTRERFQDSLASVTDFADYEALLQSTELDAVVICSPHAYHFSQIIDSLDRGCHVLTEKPLVNHVSEAHQVIAKANETGKIVGIGYQRHTEATFRFIRTAIASGEYGNVQVLTALQQQNWRKGTIGSWRQEPEISGGGQIHDSGSHLIDILLWTTGLSLESVSAAIDHRGAPVDINSAVSVRFKENAVGTITIVGDAEGWYEDITIWCDRGTFYVRNGGLFQVQRPNGSMFTPNSSEMPSGSDVDTNFIAAIHGEEEIGAPPICGLRTIELTEAAWKSAEQGGARVMVYE